MIHYAAYCRSHSISIADVFENVSENALSFEGAEVNALDVVFTKNFLGIYDRLLLLKLKMFARVLLINCNGLPVPLDAFM